MIVRDRSVSAVWRLITPRIPFPEVFLNFQVKILARQREEGLGYAQTSDNAAKIIIRKSK